MSNKFYTLRCQTVLKDKNPKKFLMVLYVTIIFLLFLLPIVDSINGFLLRLGYFSIAIPYKMLILTVLLLYSFLEGGNKSFLYILLYTISSFSMIFFYHSISLYDKVTTAFLDLSWFIKFFLFLSALFFFLSSKKINVSLLFKLSIWYFIVYSFNILLGFLGLGYSQYSGNIGGIGFIYAGNELSFTLFSVSSIILIYLLSNRLLLYFYIFFFLAIAISVIKATKTALLALFILPILFLIILLIHNSSALKVKKKLLCIFIFHLFLSAILLPVAIYILLFKVGLIKRILFWIEKVDIFTLLLSNRNNLAVDLLATISKNTSPCEYIFGYGIPYLRNLHISEIDPIDIFFSYGILGLLNIYGILFFLFYKILKLKHNSEIKLLVASTILIAVSISSIAGHVVNSGLAAIPFAMLISVAFKFKRYNPHKGVLK